MNRAAEAFDGFEAIEMYPPASADENEWVVVFRFTGLDQLTTWLGSDSRRALLAEGEPFFESPQSQEIPSRAAHPPPTPSPPWSPTTCGRGARRTSCAGRNRS
jgi:antibiotic biosynthesis monooxygenase (ABM) superfamily enzyme